MASLELGQKRLVIAVDGLAGSGKTALSRALAHKIGYIHLSTGMIYRAVALLVLRQGGSMEDPEGVIKLLDLHEITARETESCSAGVAIDGVLVGGEISQPRVSEATSLIARHGEVRAALLEMQRQAFPGRDMVVEGRDIGTIVFPNAELKLFIQASPEVRAARRLTQLAGGQGLNPDELNRLKKELQIEIEERDRRDTERLVAPTKPAPDAIMVDNSIQTLTEVINAMYDLAALRGLVRF